MRDEKLAEQIMIATVKAVDVPVTMKMRMGIDEDHQTYLDAGRIAEHHARGATAGSSAEVLIGLSDADRGVADAKPKFLHFAGLSSKDIK